MIDDIATAAMTESSIEDSLEKLRSHHPEEVKVLDAFRRLQVLSEDVFWPVLKTSNYGIDRKVAAIEAAAGIEPGVLKQLCPGRLCGQGINAMRSTGFLAGLKIRLRDANLLLDAQFPAIREQMAADDAHGGSHWLHSHEEGDSSWLWAAARMIIDSLTTRPTP